MYFRNLKMCTWANSEDPDEMPQNVAFHHGIHCLPRKAHFSGTEIHHILEIPTCDPLKYIMDDPILIVSNKMEEPTNIQRVPLSYLENRLIWFCF